MIIFTDGFEMTMHANKFAIAINKDYPHGRKWRSLMIDPTNINHSCYKTFYNHFRTMKPTSRANAFKDLITIYNSPAITTHLNHDYSKVLNQVETNTGCCFSDWFKNDTENNEINPQTDTAPEVQEQPIKTTKELCIEAMQKLINFFSEFQFAPSFRFVNTLTHTLLANANEAPDYIHNYFALLDSPYVKEITEKIKSAEFQTITQALKENATPSTNINQRIKIYYGSAGTGKTTLAQTETENRCIVCNNSMLPADLMEDFCFEDGHPSFKPSLLWDCMEKGLPVVLDEINLLPFDSLRFLQGIVDGKSEFYYKNRAVHIADGFQIIGTMNLTLNGMVYGLPEPLVDRCSSIREFTLTAEQLYNAVA